jgi:hypothetical protein
MKYTIEMTSDGMIYIPSFVTIGSGIQVILRLLPEQFERLQCWYYRFEISVKYVVKMVSDFMIYMPSFIRIGPGVQRSLGRIRIQTLKQ